MNLLMRLQVCFPLLGLLLLSVAAAEPSQESVVRAVEGHYNRIRSFEADFVQRYTQGAYTLVESGHVYFKKPGRMRWEYDSPEDKVFLTDNEHAYLYEPRAQQVRRYRVKEAPQWQAAFSLLLREDEVDLGRLFDRIQVVRIHRLEGPARWQLRGLPKSDKQAFQEMWLDLNERFQVVRVEIRQRDGSLMEYHFRRWQEEVSLDSGLFRLQVPPGTAWITEEGS